MWLFASDEAESPRFRNGLPLPGLDQFRAAPPGRRDCPARGVPLPAGGVQPVSGVTRLIANAVVGLHRNQVNPSLAHGIITPQIPAT